MKYGCHRRARSAPGSSSVAGEGRTFPAEERPLDPEIIAIITDFADGVNFALFSAHATLVGLCLFDAGGEHEQHRLPLPACSDQVWHGFLPDAKAGLLYGFHVHGPFEPAEGHRFNPDKLLIDPYVRDFNRVCVVTEKDYGYLSSRP